jgi:hypothetical protein
MHSPWRLDGRRASLELGPLHALVDLEHPESGLTQLRRAGTSIPQAQILGVELPPTDHAENRFVDAYLRGTDLIGTYAEVAQPSLRWQIYWRASADRFPQTVAAIEAIVSVQTGLLDSEPRLTLSTTVPAVKLSLWRASGDDVLRCDQFDALPTTKTMAASDGWGCFGFDLPDGAGSYLEMVHPADFSASSVEAPLAPRGEARPGENVSLRHRLFSDRLEKGVILRSRVLALFFAQRPTSAMVAEIRDRLVDEELPLTT